MRHKAIVIVLAMVTACAFLGPASAGGEHRDDRGHDRSYVLPCSLDGVNPVYHPEIFASPTVARSYGFVRTANGWRVMPGCRR
jgi:hypothetical protein